MQFSPAVSGGFSWEDESTVTFSPSTSWDPDTDIVITVTSAAKSADDQPLQQAVSLAYHTADYLQLVQNLPVEEAIMLIHLRQLWHPSITRLCPWAPAQNRSPPAFTLSPEADGRGEWINTSTYIFYPEPGLYGGQNYYVQLDPALESVDGTPLDESVIWLFNTAPPRLDDFDPQPSETQVRLDEEIKLVFNQPMDQGQPGERIHPIPPGWQCCGRQF